MAEKRGKILVIRGGAIGDFILTLPAIAALREAFPETYLEVLGYPVVAELARAAGLIDAFHPIDARPLAGFFARNARLDDKTAATFESAAIIVSYLYDPDEIFKTNVLRTTKAQFIQGRHRPDEREDLHATSVFLRPLEKLAIYNADPIPRLRLHEGNTAASKTAAHPGSGSEKKNWPEPKWAELLPQLRSDILLAGGEAEGERLNRLARVLPPNRAQIVQSRPLASLARELAACGRFIGHDSGITHLAAALGVPTLALWGPSNDRIWRPLNPNARILKPDGGLENLSAAAVLEALGE